MTPPSLRTRILVGPALRAQPDRRLVSLAREGDGPALEEVVRRYRPALVRYAGTIVPADRADDVVQDSIARALPAIRGGDADLNLRPWLYTIVRNTALNNIRDAGPSMDHLDENYDGVEQPPQALERREELAAMVAGVQALPETQREALVKREMEGMSHAEIGASMGVSIAAARQLIHRGRLTLREGLGALIPMPVMRQLLEGMSAPAAAGTGAGGALAAKAIVALLVAGGAVTAGVALDRHSHGSAQADPVIAQEIGPPGDTGSPGASGPTGSDARGSSGTGGEEPGAAGRQGAGHEGGGGSSGQSLGIGGGGAGSGDDGGRHVQAPSETGDDGSQGGLSHDGGHHEVGSGGDDSGHGGSGGGSEHGGSGDEGSGGQSGGSGDPGEGTGGGDEGTGSSPQAEGSGSSGSGDSGDGGGLESGSGSADGPVHSAND